MTRKRTVAIAAATFAFALGAAGAAQAGDKHWRGGHRHHHHVPPGHVYVVQPAPVVYAPAPMMIMPAPVYAAPVYAAPVYAVPSRPVISFGAVIPLR